MEPRQITPDELRTRMDALGFTAYRLAKEVGVTAQSVYYWLDGKREIPAMLERALRDVEREYDKGG